MLVKLMQKVVSFLATDTSEALSVLVIWVNLAGGNLILNQQRRILRRFF